MKLKEMTSAQIQERMDRIQERLNRYSTGDDLLDFFEPLPWIRRLDRLYSVLAEAKLDAEIDELFSGILVEM